MVRVAIVFHSMYGHIRALAEALAAGAREVEGVDVEIYRVAETLPEEVLVKMGALDAVRSLEDLPLATPEGIEGADAVVFGSPTRFGNMSAQLKTFFDQLGGLWQKGAFVGKVGSAFTSSATQHGGQESTLLSMMIPLLHLGMVVAGLPYQRSPNLFDTSEMSGGTPYGASTIASGDGSRQPNEKELENARQQGKYIAELARSLATASSSSSSSQ